MCWKEGDGSIPIHQAAGEHSGLLLELYIESFIVDMHFRVNLTTSSDTLFIFEVMVMTWF